MSRDEILSKKIKQLEFELIKFKENNLDENIILNRFWNEIMENGSPILEEVNDDSQNLVVTFVYRGNPSTENIVIQGSVPGYNYLENRMKNLFESDVWFKSYLIRNDVRFKYRLSVNDLLDDNYTVRSTNSIYDTLNRNTRVEIDIDIDIDIDESGHKIETIYSLVEMPKVRKQVLINHRENITRGKLRQFDLNCNNTMKSYKVWVYTPWQYNIDKEYNMLVLMDGLDFINDLSAVTVLDNLIFDSKIEPIIVAFVDTSGDDRYDMLTCSDDLNHFIAKDLLTWIRERYKITNLPSRNIIGGFSLGGLMASFIALNNYDIFGKVICESGSFWWNDEWILEKYRSIPKLPLEFYLNVGILEDRPYDSEPVMMDVINKFRDILLSKGYKLHYDQFESGHDYLCWGEQLGMALIYMFKK